MKKFIEEDFEIEKSSPIEFIKSILILIVLAPARFLLTLSTKIVYLPKVAIERSLLYATIISFVFAVTDVVVEMYFGTFSLNSIFLISCILCCVILAASYFCFTVGSFVIYEQMSSLMARAEPLPAEEEFVQEDDLTEEEEEREKNYSEFNKVSESTDEGDSEFNLSSVPEYEDFDSIFDDDDEIEEESDGLKIDSSVIRDFQNNLQNKIASLDGTGTKIGKKLEVAEYSDLLSEMDKSTDPSAFISDDFIKQFDSEDLEIADQYNLDSLDLGIIPNSFKALC